MNPELLPVIQSPENTDKDIVLRFQHLNSIKGKKCLCIGYTSEEVNKYIKKYEPEEIVCLTLWTDHNDAKVDCFKLIIGDITKKTPFIDNEFDAIITLSLLEHVSSLKDAFSEIRRILKPDGFFYSYFGPSWSSCVGHHIYAKPGDPLLDFTQWKMPSHIHLLCSEPEIVSFYKKNGYSDVQCNEVLHWFYQTPIINRFFFDEYLLLFNYFFYLIAIETTYMNIPQKLLDKLREIYYPYLDFSTYGGSFLLKNRK
jgi:SAM-dependent methyltransferase